MRECKTGPHESFSDSHLSEDPHRSAAPSLDENGHVHVGRHGYAGQRMAFHDLPLHVVEGSVLLNIFCGMNAV